jgi:hypothetical protein
VQLKIIYRYCLAENLKDRPEYYGKRLALESLLRAIDQTEHEVDVIFIVDGGKAEPGMVERMKTAGRTLPLKMGNPVRSLTVAMRLACREGWQDDDLVLLCEDDYLYLPEALTSLMDAAKAHPDVDYFAPYVIPPDYKVDVADRTAGGWSAVWATTETFAVRMGILRKDRRFIELFAHSGAHFDTVQFLALAGEQPYEWSTLRSELTEPNPPGGRRKRVARTAIRAALNLRGHRRRANYRQLYAPWPPVATHLETSWLAEGTDWTAVAEETASWQAG